MKFIDFKPISTKLIEIFPDKAFLKNNSFGYIQQNKNYLYLKINDDWVNIAIKNLNIDSLQAYDPHNIGAHISLIYPDEFNSINNNILGAKICFSVTNLFLANVNEINLIVLGVYSNAIQELRKNLNLDPKYLNYKNNLVQPHLTIGGTYF